MKTTSEDEREQKMQKSDDKLEKEQACEAENDEQMKEQTYEAEDSSSCIYLPIPCVASVNSASSSGVSRLLRCMPAD